MGKSSQKYEYYKVWKEFRKEKLIQREMSL